MVAACNSIATNLTKLIRKNIYNLYSKRQRDDSNFLVRLTVTRFVASCIVFHGPMHSCLGQSVLYCMHWLQNSMDDIVNNRLSVKKLFYSE